MDQQLVILQCVTQSSRPMRLIELGSIIVFLMKDTGAGLMEGKEVVKQACGRFLELLDDETISVIHYSFTEFARDQNRSTDVGAFLILCEMEAYEKLLELCLQYLDSCGQTSLSLESLGAGKDNKETLENDSDEDDGFTYRYHIENLGTIIKFDLLDQYFVPAKTAFQMWMLTYWHEDKKADF
ncbi:hypothetical protein BKA65DRAFT_578716 [Rhexocercosporidium sp. MPI-PUGE-AT-0058]|nr:hypothetical protein BKA65DRAFT_578716 [Rhexocercosporidium sp. MPI-PUGE-AT-0058]